MSPETTRILDVALSTLAFAGSIVFTITYLRLLVARLIAFGYCALLGTVMYGFVNALVRNLDFNNGAYASAGALAYLDLCLAYALLWDLPRRRHGASWIATHRKDDDGGPEDG